MRHIATGGTAELTNIRDQLQRKEAQLGEERNKAV